jgi:crossover junction endodeoxyribonuclease RuvC
VIILGIDPGVVSTGYGVLKIKQRQIELIDYGTIKVNSECELPSRLAGIYKKMERICVHYRPDALAVEDVFFNRNTKTALAVGHVRGAIMLAAAHHGLAVFTYTPLQIKQAITGYGRAGKEQVQRMLKIILKLPELPQPDHAADALAAALCHYYQGEHQDKNERGEAR